MWKGTLGEPAEELEGEAMGGMGSSASKSACALRESRRDLLMKSSSGMVEAARVGR